MSDKIKSPSARREWIEIEHGAPRRRGREGSPSARREWIEITKKQKKLPKMYTVSLREEGVD